MTPCAFVLFAFGNFEREGKERERKAKPKEHRDKAESISVVEIHMQPLLPLIRTGLAYLFFGLQTEK